MNAEKCCKCSDSSVAELGFRPYCRKHLLEKMGIKCIICGKQAEVEVDGEAYCQQDDPNSSGSAGSLPPKKSLSRQPSPLKDLVRLSPKKVVEQEVIDCPVCSDPINMLPNRHWQCTSCKKLVCNGCFYSFRKPKCPLCREPIKIVGLATKDRLKTFADRERIDEVERNGGLMTDATLSEFLDRSNQPKEVVEDILKLPEGVKLLIINGYQAKATDFMDQSELNYIIAKLVKNIDTFKKQDKKKLEQEEKERKKKEDRELLNGAQVTLSEYQNKIYQLELEKEMIRIGDLPSDQKMYQLVIEVLKTVPIKRIIYQDEDQDDPDAIWEADPNQEYDDAEWGDN